MKLRNYGILAIASLLIMVMTVLNTANAQMQQQKATPEQKAQQVAQVLSQRLDLSDDQQSQVKKLNLDMLKKREKITSNEELSRKQKIKKLRGLQGEMETKYKDILSKEQYKQYVAMKKKQRKKRKQQMKKRRQQQQQQQQGTP